MGWQGLMWEFLSLCIENLFAPCGDSPAGVLTDLPRATADVELSSLAPGQPPHHLVPETHYPLPRGAEAPWAPRECQEIQSALLSHPLDFCLMSK